MGKILIRGLGSIIFLSIAFSLYSTHDFKPARKVMVFAPHPDDDIIGCGGSLIMHKKNGADIVIVYMTSGDKGSKGSPAEIARIREEEAKKATAKIGIEHLIFLREPDARLAHSRENIKKVTKIITKFNPEIVYVTHKLDGHDDHKTTFRIVESALMEISKKKLAKMPTILCYEVWTPLKKVTHKVNIGPVMDIKLAALTEHRSQDFIIDLVKSGKTMRCGKTFECFESISI